jgi:guanosine-3',5'-bis(diphosphate) 3'-pyrophosphohydrolase
MSDLLSKVMDTAVYVAVKHQYLRRGGFEQLPYINHLLKVTRALIDIAEERDEAVLLAALLHDVVEDTDTSLEEISSRYGQEVASIVEELTDDMSLPYEERKQIQVEGADKLSPKAQLIRIVDKASNIRDIFSYPLDWPMEKKIAYVKNAEAVFEKIKGNHARVDAWMEETLHWAYQIIRQTESKEA